MVGKTIALVKNKPLVAVNHLEGHIYSSFLVKKDENFQFLVFPSRDRTAADNFQKNLFPVLVLIVSGGHTELVLWEGHGAYKTIGATIDDAAGEAFDKVAKILGLEYPGGPSVSKEAEKYRESIIKNEELRIKGISLPRPMMDSGDYNFSFSVLKTAVLYKVRDMVGAIPSGRPKQELRDEDIVALAYEFQEAVVEVLVEKTKRAYEEFGVKRVAVVGGVAANKRLRERMAEEFGNQLIVPPIKYCTDNGVKIAVAGVFKYLQKDFTRWQDLEVKANWEL
ncbi:tRNA (adenosine(37)-N6)-threonylcarbamoyltransferase complex transferase subunit TsaD, partial [Patescibacteria group bacterium]|nr:tRNA (adenosine(37)-N6)-threonylcarbamoyltransferase complex transferase subunit TsaD [Patescibacteria group bacterium]